MSAFNHLSSLDLQRIWNGVHGRVIHGQQITLGVIELDPDSVVPEHRHENEQLGICLNGSLVFRVGDESRELAPGATWSIPANVPHEVQVGPDGAVEPGLLLFATFVVRGLAEDAGAAAGAGASVAATGA